MFTAEEATKQRIDAYVGGLAVERESYEARIARLKAGRKDPLLAGDTARDEAIAQLSDRVKQVDAEQKRCKTLKTPKADADAE